MRVISNRVLVAFGTAHPDANEPLQAWKKLIESKPFRNFQDLRNTFGSVDVDKDKYIFDIRGNRYRIIAGISFLQQVCYIKHVLTHAEYDKGKWK
jgi:mRNA interferase HigB